MDCDLNEVSGQMALPLLISDPFDTARATLRPASFALPRVGRRVDFTHRREPTSATGSDWFARERTVWARQDGSFSAPIEASSQRSIAR
jgi:hypothetical protein